MATPTKVVINAVYFVKRNETFCELIISDFTPCGPHNVCSKEIQFPNYFYVQYSHNEDIWAEYSRKLYILHSLSPTVSGVIYAIYDRSTHRLCCNMLIILHDINACSIYAMSHRRHYYIGGRMVCYFVIQQHNSIITRSVHRNNI